MRSEPRDPGEYLAARRRAVEGRWTTRRRALVRDTEGALAETVRAHPAVSLIAAGSVGFLGARFTGGRSALRGAGRAARWGAGFLLGQI